MPQQKKESEKRLYRPTRAKRFMRIFTLSINISKSTMPRKFNKESAQKRRAFFLPFFGKGV